MPQIYHLQPYIYHPQEVVRMIENDLEGAKIVLLASDTPAQVPSSSPTTEIHVTLIRMIVDDNDNEGVVT